jgi:hypothetical protein
MSQFYQGSTAGSLPPTVPLSISVDINEPTTSALPASSGTVSAVGQTLRLGGANGIQTIQNATAGNLIIGFVEASGPTNGAVTASLSLAVPNNSAETFQIIVSGLADDNSAIGAWGTATAKNIGGTASIVGICDLIVNAEAALTGANVTVSASGGNFLVTVTGVAGKLINWNIALPGIVGTYGRNS